MPYVTVKIKNANERYPVRTFLLLRQPELGPAMAADPDCVKGLLVTGLEETCDLGSHVSQLKLTVYALLLQGNAVRKKVLNASLRRYVKSRPQTNPLSLADLSVAHVGRDSRCIISETRLRKLMATSCRRRHKLKQSRAEVLAVHGMLSLTS